MYFLEYLFLTIEEYFGKAFAEVPGNIKSQISKVMNAVNLDIPLDRKVGDLSGGQQARILLAFALIQNPDIISRGFIFLKENKELIEDLRHRVKKIVTDSDPLSWADTNNIRNKIRDYVGQFLFTKTEKRPMVLPVVIQV